MIRRLYDALVELEALATTVDEAITMLPAGPTGRHKRTRLIAVGVVGCGAFSAYDLLGSDTEATDLQDRSVMYEAVDRCGGRNRLSFVGLVLF